MAANGDIQDIFFSLNLGPRLFVLLFGTILLRFIVS